MRGYLTGLLCCSGAVVYLLFYTLENRGARRLRGAAASPSVLRRHWTDRVLAQYKGGVLYAMRKTMWNCLGQWARSQDEGYDLTVNVGLDGRYCVRAGGRANKTHA